MRPFFNINQNTQKDINKLLIPKPKTNQKTLKKSITNVHKLNKENEEHLLDILYQHLLKVYQSKKYQKIISDIEEKDNLLNKNSLASFNLLYLKILCFLKEFNLILENELNNPFEKNIGFKPLENQLNKIQEEFRKLLTFANNENNIHYEKITQLYSKILFCFSLLYRLKDDYTKCLSNIILSLNLLKIFFIKNIKGNEIKTYKIYCINILHAISLFIMDNNIKEALKYAYLLLKICEISIKICKLNNNQNKIPNFIDFLYFDFIFTGLCYEFLEDDENAFEFYKLAFNLRRLLSEKNKKRYLFFSINLTERFKEKFVEKEKIKEIQMKEQIEKEKEERIKRKLKKKNEELFYISKGFTVNPNKYNNFENYLTKKYFNSNNLKKIEKLNDDLVNLVYNNTKFNQTNSYFSEEKKKKISYETKKNLYHFEIYKNLLSDNYKKFITKNEILEFNNPVKAYDSIKKIQIYLNQQIQKNMINLKNKKNSKSMKIIKTFRFDNPKNSNKIIQSKSNQNIFNNKNNNNNKINNNNKNININNKNDNNINNNDISNNIDINNNNNNNINNNNINIYNNNNNKTGNNNNNINISNNNNNNINNNNINIYNNKIDNNNKTNNNNNNKIDNNNNNNNNISNNKINNNNKIDNNNKILNRTTSNYLTKTNPNLFPKNEKKRILLKNKSFNATSYKIIHSRNNSNNFKKNLFCLTRNLSNDFDKKNIDKFLLSKNYFNKYIYLDNLSMKELDFQKTILNLKKDHSNGYFKTVKDDFSKSNNENEIEELAYKTFIYLKNKSYDNNNNNNNINIENNIILNKFQNTNKIKGIFTGIFTGEKNRKSIADSFSKVLQKYIDKENKIKQIKMKLENQEFIKKTNEENLIKINNKIVEINNKIKNMKKK